MIYWAKVGIAGFLSLLYSAYLVELYRHLTNPLPAQPTETKKKRFLRLLLFLLGIVITGIAAYIIKEFVLSRSLFELIVGALQAIFVIPFFGAICTDRVLYTCWQERLPLAATIFIISLTAAIGFGTNLLIVFATPNTLDKATYWLDVGTDIATITSLLLLAYFGTRYWMEKKH